MRVFKFGGASVKDADGLKNVGHLLKNQPDKNLVIIVSAMGKMTNAFESLILSFVNKTNDFEEKLQFISNYHYQIIEKSFENDEKIRVEIEHLLAQINHFFQSNQHQDYDYIYDQIVIYGELLSTKIVSAYLEIIGLENIWLDARYLIKTDFQYRSAQVDWIVTQQNIQQAITQPKIYLTQGFIAGASESVSTTLGREGSDYTAAIFSYCLNAENMTIWKDVPGVLNADPRHFQNAVLLQQISYREALEMSFYGATVIHPKTIKPLENKNITLNVKSFVNPSETGTIISNNAEMIPPSVCYTLKEHQILLSVSSKDFSFMVEHNISHLFRIFSEYRIKVNLMQNSAISFSVCIEDIYNEYQNMLALLQEHYHIQSYENVKLLSIRHFTKESIEQYTRNQTVLLIQQSENTTQIILQ